jgi:hypothetical protein
MSSSDLIRALADAKPSLDPNFRDRLIYQAGCASGRANSTRAAWAVSRLFVATTIGLSILLWVNLTERPLATNSHVALPSMLGSDQPQDRSQLARAADESNHILRASARSMRLVSDQEAHVPPSIIDTSTAPPDSSILTPTNWNIDPNSI